VAATHRSQARASSGEDASRAPRTWLVSNLARGKAFEHLHFKGKKLIKDRLSFSVVSSNWALKVELLVHGRCGELVFISDDDRKVLEKNRSEELTWKLRPLRRRRSWQRSFPETGGRERGG
jgi:hypothetical protein